MQTAQIGFMVGTQNSQNYDQIDYVYFKNIQNIYNSCSKTYSYINI